MKYIDRIYGEFEITEPIVFKYDRNKIAGIMYI